MKKSKVKAKAGKKSKKVLQKGDRYTCSECGVIMSVDEACGCGVCDLICCGQPMILLR